MQELHTPGNLALFSGLKTIEVIDKLLKGVMTTSELSLAGNKERVQIFRHSSHLLHKRYKK